jgi:hypothetical protein
MHCTSDRGMDVAMTTEIELRKSASNAAVDELQSKCLKHGAIIDIASMSRRLQLS